MIKKLICGALTLVLLLGIFPVTAAAAENPDFPNNPPADVDTVEEKVDWIAQKCRETGMTETWDIALWLHDWLIHNANYDYTYNNYSASGVLLKGSGVCQSYTDAYMLLLDEFGIENRAVSSDEMNHTWNLVKIDGQWCHIDCTWDDPGEGGYECHDYFGLTDKMMSLDHTWDVTNYPACTSKINYYPIRMGLDVFATKEEWMAILDKSAANRVEEIRTYYIGDDDNFDTYGPFMEWYRSNRGKYHINAYGKGHLGGHVYYILRYRDDHEYEEIWVDSTCTEQGYIKYECECGEYYVDEDSYMDAWGHSFENGVCTRCGATGLPGDMDDNETVDVDDVLALLWYVLFPTEYPIEAEADFDGNGTTDVDDVLALLWHVLFPEEYPL